MQSHIQGVAYKGMTYAHLVHPWYVLVEVVEVDKTEVVTSVKSESQFACSHGSLNEWFYSLLAVFDISRSVRFGI